MARYREVTVGGEDVARDQRAIARVEERDVAGTVTRAGHDLEAADPVAGRKPHVRHRFDLWPTARQLALDDRLAGEDAGIHLGHEHLNRPAQPLLQRIERADVIAVAVRQRDPPDRLARFLRGSDQRPGASAERRVDQREAVFLANEECVDETPTGQLGQVLRECCGPHLVFLSSY